MLIMHWQIYLAVRVYPAVQIFILVGLVGVVAQISLLVGLVALVRNVLLISELLWYVHLRRLYVLVILVRHIPFDSPIDRAFRPNTLLFAMCFALLEIGPA